MRSVESILVGGVRRKDRLRSTWVEKLRINLKALNLVEDRNLDRSSWRRSVAVVDFSSRDGRCYSQK